MLKSFGCVIYLSSRLLLHISVSASYSFHYFSLNVLFTLKHYKRILEIWLQLIFSRFEIYVVRYLKGLDNEGIGGVCESEFGNPLASVGYQSSPKLTPTLFASLPYALNRSLDWDLFCGRSSARLRSTSHARKMNSHRERIIYAASQIVLILNGDTYFYIVTGVLQVDALVPFQSIICQH